MAYRLFNYETGGYEEVSKEIYERHKQWMDMLRGLIDTGKRVGQIIITSARLEDGEDQFYKIWRGTEEDTSNEQ